MICKKAAWCSFECSAGSVCTCDDSRLPTALHWLQLSENFCLVDWASSSDILLLVFWLL